MAKVYVALGEHQDLTPSKKSMLDTGENLYFKCMHDYYRLPPIQK